MKRKIPVIISSVWLAVIVACYVFAFTYVKYPFNAENILYPCLAIVPAVLALIFSLTFRKGKRKVFSAVLTVFFGLILLGNIVLNLAYIKDSDEPMIYINTLTSKTDNPDNYLKLDKHFPKEIKQEITDYFPSQIPENATDVEYHYAFNGGSFRYITVSVRYCLPEDEFFEKFRPFQANPDKYDNTHIDVKYDLSDYSISYEINIGALQ